MTEKPKRRKRRGKLKQQVQKLQKSAEPPKGRHNRITTADQHLLVTVSLRKLPALVQQREMPVT